MDALIHIPGATCHTVNKSLHKDERILIFKVFPFLKFVIILKPWKHFWAFLEAQLS